MNEKQESYLEKKEKTQTEIRYMLCLLQMS